MLIGIDSIMSHLAGALEVPAVVMYKGGNPKKYVPFNRKKFKVIDFNFKAENILRSLREI